MKKKTHSEAFRRHLVHEALNRTPSGGFSVLEKRHKLRSGTLFDWVAEFSTDLVPTAFSAQHVWIGNSATNTQEFNRYFDYDANYWNIDEDLLENAKQDLTGCRFCQEIGSRNLYDEDLLLVVHKSKPMAVPDLLRLGALTSDTAFAAVLEACSRHNITAANAMFIYSDPLLSIADIHKRYNGLHYMGLFAR